MIVIAADREGRMRFHRVPALDGVTPGPDVPPQPPDRLHQSCQKLRYGHTTSGT